MDKPDDVPRSRRAFAICLAVTAVLTVVDLWSKSWALETLSAERLGDPPPVCEPDEQGYTSMQRARGDAIVVVDDLMELRYAENCGAAFGLLKEAPAWVRHSVFGLAAVIASIALMLMFVRGRGGTYFAAAVPFIVSGAIGNLVDRLRYGYVVDFIRVYWDREIFGMREWPTFNVADITITMGVVLLLIDGWLEGRKEKAAKQAAKAKATA
ncbi:MAG: signal peptidase II [Myxococcota bacterium]